jgi:HEAT repeat protein
MVMGKVGSPSALGPLKTVLGDETNETAKYNMTEALAALGDGRGQSLLEGYANGIYLDLQLVAIPAIAKFQTPYARQVLRELLANAKSTRVRVSAAGALGLLGEFNSGGYDLCIQSCKDPRAMMERGAIEDPIRTGAELASLQQLAARSLGWMNRPQAVATLEGLLHHADPAVRVMAAMSIIRLLNHPKETAPPIRQVNGA